MSEATQEHATNGKANGKKLATPNTKAPTTDKAATKTVPEVLIFGGYKETKIAVLDRSTIRVDPKKNEREAIDLRRPSPEFIENAASIRERGLLHPVTVRKLAKPEGSYLYELVAGYGRFAMHEAFEGADQEGRKIKFEALPQIKATIYENMTDLDVAGTRAIENFGRTDLSSFEKANVMWNIKTLSKEAGVNGGAGYTDAELGRVVHYDRTAVHNMLAWQKLIPKFKTALRDGLLSTTEANRFCYKTKDEQNELYEAWAEQKKAKDDEGDKDKKGKKGKKDTAPRMLRRDDISMLALDISKAEEIRIGGSFEALDDKTKSAIKGVLRYVLGETSRYPVPQQAAEEEEEDEG